MVKLKNFVSGLADLVFGFAYFLVLFGIVSWSLYGDKSWFNITLGDFFNGSKLFYILATLSIFYIPLRLLLREKFWGIIFSSVE